MLGLGAVFVMGLAIPGSLFAAYKSNRDARDATKMKFHTAQMIEYEALYEKWECYHTTWLTEDSCRTWAVYKDKTV